MHAVKKARIHSVSLFFWKGREGGVITIRSNHQSLIGYKNNFYPIRSRRGVDKNAGKLTAAGSCWQKGQKGEKRGNFHSSKTTLTRATRNIF